jgi:RNA polymerase sigma-70 factor (ECF subfamily)
MRRLLHIEVPAEVVRGAREGRPEAQSAVYRAYSDGVYALIRRLVPRPAVADDLFQDTFVEVLQSIGQFRGEAPLGAWIRRIAVSKCLMYLRSPWNRRLLWLDGQGTSPQDTGVGSTPLDSLVEAPAADSGIRIDLDAALERLSPAARAVLWLHDVEGYTHVEIAALCGKTVSFSKSQLMRAHLRLRELLEDRIEVKACMPVSTSS